MSGIFDKLREWGRPWASGSEPVELHRAILEDVLAQVVAVGGGRRVFPFDRVEVTLLAASPEERIRLEAVAQNGWDLGREARQRFEAQGVRFPAGLALPVQVVDAASPEPGSRRYSLAFRKADPVEPGGTGSAGSGSGAGTGVSPARGGRPVLTLTPSKGKTEREVYAFPDAERVYLGRLAEVLDAAGRVKRRNDVAFLEDEDLSQTVSREHARIAWDPESAAFWLRDEGSASGTLLFRAGRSIEVSRHDRRGVRLADGDEVYLGRAAVRVQIGG
jgi:FHA domain